MWIYLFGINDYQRILQFLFFTKNVSVLRVLQNLRYYSDSRENELGYSFLFYYIVLHDRLGVDPGFFLGGGALVSCSTSTPINHIVFFFAEYQLN